MDAKNIIMLSMVKGIGPVFIKRNIDRLLTDTSCRTLIQENRPEEMQSIDNYSSEADAIIEICKKEGIEIIPITSSSYPKQLLEINDPPSVLYLKGNKTLLNRIIAIIGTRHSTPLGNNIAERLGSYFSTKFSICNGLVEGIDEHSIYSNGKVLSNVVGVISGGLCYKETCTPRHIKIIDDVLSNEGLIISEFPPKQKEDMYSGSKASRIQAGLSDGLILVQSKINGGSKYTLSTFSKLNRTIGVILFPSTNEYSSPEFDANRLIVEKGVSGVAEMIGSKKTNNIRVKSIIAIESRDDYKKIEISISNQEQESKNLFD